MSMKKYFLLILCVFFVGCAGSSNQQEDLINVLDINKKLQELENRIAKNEKRVDEFSVIATSWAKKEKVDFPVAENSKLASTYASVNIVNSVKREPLVPEKELEPYLFISHLDKKTFDFKRIPIELQRDAIVYNKKGEEVLLLRKSTIIESSYRVNKYFQIDAYNYNNDYHMPNIELFISEEAFLK